MDILQFVVEKTFAHPLDTRHISISSRRKLIAIVTGGQQVECFRFNGSRAFWHKRSGAANIAALSWVKHKDNLQVVWDDGKLELIDPTTGKATRAVQLRPEDEIKEGFPLAGFASTFYEPASKPVADLDTRSRPQAVKEMEDFLAKMHGPKMPQSQLPQEMAWYDVQAELPKLSVLQATSRDPVISLSVGADILTKEDLLDANLSSPYLSDETSPEPFALSVAAWTDGTLCFVDQASDVLRGIQYIPPEDVQEGTTTNNDDEEMLTDHPTIQNTPPEAATAAVSIGKFNFIEHAWHSSSSFHFFLAEHQTPSGKTTQSFNLVSFGGLKAAAPYLNQLDFMLKRLQLLSQYILQVIINIRNIFQEWRRVPGSWIESADEVLAESTYALSFADALFRFAVTGDLVDPIREWARERLQPTTMQRWTTAIKNGYANILDSIHNCLLPAVDRAAVVCNRLSIMNRMSEIDLLSGMSLEMSRMINYLDALRLSGHAVMHHAATESRQFDEFATWLTRTVEFALAEPGGATAGEIAEKLSNADLNKVLPYISGGLQNSKLEELLGSPSAKVLHAVEAGADIPVERFKECLLQHKHSKTASSPDDRVTIDVLYHAVGLDRTAEGVTRTVNGTFQASIATRSWPVTRSYMLVSDIRDMRMVREVWGTPAIVFRAVTYVATVVADGFRQSVCLYRIATHGPEPQHPSEASTIILGPVATGREVITFPEGFKIASLCFVDDHSYLILLHIPGISRILKLPICTAPTSKQPPRGVDAMFDQVRMASSQRAEAVKAFSNSFEFRPQADGVLHDWFGEASIDVDCIGDLTVATFLHPGDLVTDFLPGKLVYESGKLAVVGKDFMRVKLYYDVDLIDADREPQGNPARTE